MALSISPHEMSMASATPKADISGGKASEPEAMEVLGRTLSLCVAESGRRGDHSQGFHDQKQVHVTAIDIDQTAVHMGYVQLFLLHIPAVVLRGDTLRMEMEDHWATAAHVLDLWEWKLRRAKKEQEEKAEAAATVVAEPEPGVDVTAIAESSPAPELGIPEPVRPSVTVGSQLSLFSVYSSQALPQPKTWGLSD
jgi:hypothetical protein